MILHWNFDHKNSLSNSQNPNKMALPQCFRALSTRLSIIKADFFKTSWKCFWSFPKFHNVKKLEWAIFYSLKTSKWAKHRKELKQERIERRKEALTNRTNRKVCNNFQAKCHALSKNPICSFLNRMELFLNVKHFSKHPLLRSQNQFLHFSYCTFVHIFSWNRGCLFFVGLALIIQVWVIGTENFQLLGFFAKLLQTNFFTVQSFDFIFLHVIAVWKYLLTFPQIFMWLSNLCCSINSWTMMFTFERLC